jgi:hypothetical protein
MPNMYKITLPRGVVSWYIASQSDAAKSMTIKDGNNTMVVDTKVFSKSLSNFSTGSFTSAGGEHVVSFPDCRDVKKDQATIVNSHNQTIVVTNQYAGEDGSDGDYNDIYAAVTWYQSAG